jgi:hypothetical protein
MTYYTPSPLGRFEQADNAWQDELEARFGRRARDARYTAEGRGAEGTKLRRLYELRTIAMQSWHASRATA